MKDTKIKSMTTLMSDYTPDKEICNVALLQHILDNQGDYDLSTADLNQMKRILRRANKDTGRYEPLYEQKGANLVGRVFCKTGLCALSREWRNALAFKNYLDADMVNASYSIALQMANKWDLPTDKLTEYCNNRDNFLMDYIKNKKERGIKISKDDAKIHYIKLLFGVPSKMIVKKSLEWELKLLQDRCITECPKLVKAVEHDMKKKKETYNKRGKVLSHAIFNEENRILQLAIKYLQKDGYVVGGTMFDGFFVEKKDGICLNNLNNYLKDVEDINIVFTFKEMRDFPKGLSSDLINLSRQEQLEADEQRYLELREVFEHTEGIAKIKLRNGFLVIRPNGNCFVSSTALKEMYCDWNVAEGFRTNFITGGKAQKLFIENWILDPNKRIYDDQTFIPSITECPDNMYNTFRGFSVANASKNFDGEFSETDQQDYQYVLQYIKNLFSEKGSKEQTDINYIFFCCWLANIFQNPTKKSEIMIVLKGKKGIGKSDLINMLERMLGEDFVFQTSDPAREVWGPFNDAMESKIVCSLDEVCGLENGKFVERLKGAITGHKINIKKKYKDISREKSYLNFILTLNDEDTGIRITDDNRRFAMFESGMKRISENDYGKYYEAQRNPNALILFYRMLMNMDLTDIQFDRDFIPQTAFLLRSKMNSIKNYHSFLEQLLIDEHTRHFSKVANRWDGMMICLCGDLYKGYIRYCESSGDIDYNSKVKNSDFKKEMLSLEGVSSKHTSHKPSNINGQCYIIDASVLKNNLQELGLPCDADTEQEFLSD